MATIDRYVTETASIKSRRSIFPMSRRVLTSYFHGYLQPIGVPIEVLPGDTWRAHVATLIRMSTPLRPLMDNIRFELDAFFVPKRILSNKTKQFYGEAPTFGIAEKIEEPYLSVESDNSSPLVIRDDLTSNIFASESLFASFGLVSDSLGDIDPTLKINVLPIRAYLKCYNEFYRDQNYQEPYKWDMDQTGLVDEVAFKGLVTINQDSLLPLVNKDKDVLISILPWAQKGEPVVLPLGESVPVTTGDRNWDLAGSNPIQYANPDGDESSVLLPWYQGLYDDDAENGFFRTMGMYGSDNHDTPDQSYGGELGGPLNLYADLTKATGTSINNLLYALAYQDFLVRAAHYGTKYKEYIYSMFGTTIADATEDIPEYLGRLKLNVNINQVLSTMDQGSGLGEVGAYSVTGGNKALFRNSFTEPGYLVFIGYCKHARTYSSGIDPVFMKTELLDYYQPPFANTGDVPVSTAQFFSDDSHYDLGFQEPFFDYHVLQDRVYGILNPLMPNSLANWTLAERFTEPPILSASFIEEDRTALIDALVSGENGPDYIMDFEFRFEATRVMPLFSSNRLGSL